MNAYSTDGTKQRRFCKRCARRAERVKPGLARPDCTIKMYKSFMLNCSLLFSYKNEDNYFWSILNLWDLLKGVGVKVFLCKNYTFTYLYQHWCKILFPGNTISISYLMYKSTVALALLVIEIVILIFYPEENKSKFFSIYKCYGNTRNYWI